jgi:hypothetical protein
MKRHLQCQQLLYLGRSVSNAFYLEAAIDSKNKNTLLHCISIIFTTGGFEKKATWGRCLWREGKGRTSHAG